MFRRILVPLDGSAIAEAALEPALFIARAAGAQLKLVRAPQHDSEEWDCREYLLEQVQLLGSQGTPVQIEVLDTGAPVAQRILEVITEEDIDLVLMTSHGRGNFSRLLLGSVTDQVVREATCPVMVVGRKSQLVATQRERRQATP